MINTLRITALSMAVLSALAIAQTTKPAAPAAPAAAPAAARPAANPLVNQAHFDMLLKGEIAQGRADTPELRAAINDELTNRGLMEKEAKAKGMDKDAGLKTQMEMAAQSVLLRTYLQEVMKSNEPKEADYKAEYDRAVSAMGSKEYKARHILVDKKEQADDIIKSLQLGEKFEKLATQSKDEGSKANGGDLDWAAPGNYVKPFADAMVALQKGKFTAQAVQSQFGWHVIQLDDVRDAKVPSYEEVKPQIQQGFQQRVVESHIMSLRQKAGVK